MLADMRERRADDPVDDIPVGPDGFANLPNGNVGADIPVERPPVTEQPVSKPATPADQIWYCSHCDAEIDRGPTAPSFASCPRCGASLQPGSWGAIVVVIAAVGVAFAGFVALAAGVVGFLLFRRRGI
jgi:hypothetical protein